MNLKRRGIGILLTDHSVRETLAITDRAYIVHDGRILVSGTADKLINDPQVRKVYLGETFQADGISYVDNSGLAAGGPREVKSGSQETATGAAGVKIEPHDHDHDIDALVDHAIKAQVEDKIRREMSGRRNAEPPA